MPRIFDNIGEKLLPALRSTLEVSERSDFCVGYFNLRGWKCVDDLIERWEGGEGHQCRLLVGMQRLPQDELRAAIALRHPDDGLDNQTALRLKQRLAEDFRDQLALGAPTNSDEAGLRRLVGQLRAKKLSVRLYLRHPLHAKVYLHFRADRINPIVGYLGSSNLTLSGLSEQGELNVDVLDGDAGTKLARWFEDRWTDRWSLDITQELISTIEASWAREELIPPYLIYVKMAYHLSQEARAGLSEFRIPSEFGNRLFEYQIAAVKIAAHHLGKRRGVLIGDVVGLGKTLMACALVKIYQDDYFSETLIICPRNLVRMWEEHVAKYRLLAKVLSVTRASRELPTLRRYQVVLIDESQNLRNREGKRYRIIREYIQANESKCVLLSATPYNKTYLDLSSQLRLFVPEDMDLGIRPERLLREIGEAEFTRHHQCPPRSLSAFEKSEYADDWRDLMRLFMIRRTSSFIKENYAELDSKAERRFLTFEDGTRSYFPVRVPKTVRVPATDPLYSQLYSDEIVQILNTLKLPRYGLGNYVAAKPPDTPSDSEAKQLRDLSRAGKRLVGFCRTNILKRLESSGASFLLSVERQILRNYVYLHAIKSGLPLPLGPQDTGMLDAGSFDEDPDAVASDDELFEEDVPSFQALAMPPGDLSAEKLMDRGKDIYNEFQQQYPRRFRWIRACLFTPQLEEDLASDSASLVDILNRSGEWDPGKDVKLDALYELVSSSHPSEKVLVFSQFADTVRYLERQLRRRGVRQVAGVTGESDDPTSLAWRFSPGSNGKRDEVPAEEELRVIVATDVLSEGQNLQDCRIVVNFDLPWAIIRLIQRAGRVDRIGQHAERILSYSFLPADGIERLLRLRARVRSRLQENAEVVGTDEAFFEDEGEHGELVDLYNEKAGILDTEPDAEVDLSSYAYQIWKNAIKDTPELATVIPALPPVCFATKQYGATDARPHGALVYVRTGDGNDALAWVDMAGKSVTESQFDILRAAECLPATEGQQRSEKHHDLVRKGVDLLVAEGQSVGGQLGRPSGARFRTYERLKRYAERIRGTLFESPELVKTIEQIYRYPLRQSAADTLNRQLRTGISDQELADLVLALREEDRLCLVQEGDRPGEPQIICSLGLVAGTGLGL